LIDVVYSAVCAAAVRVYQVIGDAGMVMSLQNIAVSRFSVRCPMCYIACFPLITGNYEPLIKFLYQFILFFRFPFVESVTMKEL